MGATRYLVYATVTPGLEALAERELARILPAPLPWRKSQGGLEARLAAEDLWRVAHGSRLLESLRVRIGAFEARDFAALEAGIGRLPWAAYIPAGAALVVVVECRASALYHSGAVEERARQAIVGLRGKPVDDAPSARVYLRLVRDRVQVSVGASGELLHRRGYRRDIGKAPLRETLAAALLELAAYDPARPLWDPFAGSGTIPIEAASRARGLPAPVGRGFGFEAWPSHDVAAYRTWRDAARRPAGAAAPAMILGSDLDPAEIASARANAERAGVLADLALVLGDFGELARAAAAGSQVVTNLPYGKRSPASLALYERFGRLLAERPDLDPVVVLSGHPKFAPSTGLAWEVLAGFKNQGLPVEVLKLSRPPR
jgi:putative N6-adenine-specific DNA methylase